MIHTGEKTNKCFQCDKAFSHDIGLLSHTARVHQNSFAKANNISAKRTSSFLIPEKFDYLDEGFKDNKKSEIFHSLNVK